ncbi:MAG: histidine phosphatase family protein [Pseudomonadota bacterium]
MRYIWVIRHAKSADGNKDHARPLNKRGQDDAARMQAWYAARNHPAEWIWASSAVRAQQTAEFVAAGFGARLVTEPDLYLSGAETLLDCLRGTPEEIQSVAVVAHNPGLTYLVNLLGVDNITDNLPTLGSALFATENSWSNLAFGVNHFISLNTPKSIGAPE